MWTGPTVCSPQITTLDATAWKAALPHHQLVVWDNYPVNDGTMASRLHLGPYRGRSHDLDSVVHGILLNPMNQAVASRIPLATAAKYLSAPSSYDPDEEFRIACGDTKTVLFASTCYDGPPNPPETSPIHVLVDSIVNLRAPLSAQERDALQQELLLTKTAAKKITASETPFAVEVAPWAQRIAIESRAGLAALRVLDLCAQDPPPILDLMGAIFAMAFHWTQARRSEHVVFGPRFAIYPAIVMHTSGQPSFSAHDGILENRNAIDALCRFAALTADETNAR
jgi:beta-N-acetylglucosaminidase